MRGPASNISGRLPTAIGGIARLACLRAKAAGLDLIPFLRKCHLTIREIQDRNARLKVQSQIQLLALIAAALPDDCLGLHLSLGFDLREFGLLYYTMASCATLGEAIMRAARYSAIANEGIALSLIDGDEIQIAFDYVGVPRHSDRHQIEFWVATLMRLCREVTGVPLVPRQVRFLHQRSDNQSEFTLFFGSDIAFGAGRDALVFSRSVLALPLVHADPYLNKLLVKDCEEALARRPKVNGTLRSAVENAITPLLPHGKARLADVADRLGMSQRTLARRLASDGLSFNGVLEQLRADLAQRHLRDSELSISQIAWLLGYQEVSAFTHAFKRWTGTTPRMVRSKEHIPTV
jgi:AraC-like DNA-binding protein